ncbi:MAG: uncharacterized protein QOE19_800 [Actinomycetota bacterium]|jgi:uncharacterized protein YqgC (DUF456 family)|nr:uncharacterized protein [Actinomycetota bacterium]MDQ1666169.1 uncharacterized protein [Actinomycetota bacterium]MDQ1671261.1 uncharacterized protein [Actinomycetota bacterium]
MTGAGELLIGLLMLVGVIGVVVPVLPGLLLVWGAAVAWAWLDGGGPVRWGAVVLITLAFVAATVLKYVLPARSATGAGAPRSTLLVGAVAAVVGFFVIPVIGFVVGGIGAIFLLELARLGSAAAAWRSTRAVLVAVGVGVLVELAAALAMVAIWLAAVLAT